MANSQYMSTTNQYIVYWIEAYTNSQSGNSSNITVRVWCKRTNEGYTTYGNGTVYINADGQTSQSGITNSQTLTSTPRLLHESTHTINHNSDGTKSVYIQAYITHDRFSSSWQGWTYTLNPIKVIPTAPTSCTASGKYEVGEKITVNWSGATGAISAYQIQYCQYDMKTGWGAWYNIVEGAVGTTAINNITSVGAFKTKVKYRVRAVNSSGNSAWSPESNIIEHYGIKLWNDNNFKWGNIKVWNGSAWVQGHLLAWSGSEWITTK